MENTENKMYKYKGAIYCEVDLSEEIGNYSGDLYDLMWEMKMNGLCSEVTVYCAGYFSECEFAEQANSKFPPVKLYADYKDMINECFSDFELTD